MIRNLQPKKIAFISSFLPRKCGIATFTSDLIKNVRTAGGVEFSPSVFAMQSGDEHTYSQPVEFVIRRDVAADYIDAADYSNSKRVDIVSLQHEFGLFGAEAGLYITLLLERIKAPVITTLHTILEKPSPWYFDALMEVCEASETIVVMNERGVDMLMDIYAVPERKIRLIPHGIPDMPFLRASSRRRSLSLSGRKIILTFGLIGRNKGIEVMLKAMPAIVRTHPEVLYIVLGTTHPEVVKNEGYSYREELFQLVEELGLQNHVVFHEKYVSDTELQEFLYASDIYVTPYLYKEQLTSGTLAFAVGTGKAVVSTPYWAAEELLAENRGKLVAFGDSEQMASTVIELLDDDTALSQMQLRAYQYGRAITWPKVGRAYWNLLTHFEQPTMETAVPERYPDIKELQPVMSAGADIDHSMSLSS